jgi:hypothetical protein
MNLQRNDYSRIEINLLPPELAPGPAVRILVLVNVAVITITLATVLVATALPLSRIAIYTNQIESQQSQIASLKPIEDNFQSLSDIKDAVDQYGRIVSLASVDYVEVPLLMDRIATLLPDGVYLKQIQNRRANARAGGNGGASPDVIVQMSLGASKRDPKLLIDTVTAFKKDALFNDCYLSMAEAVETPLGEMLSKYGIQWQVEGPDSVGQPSAHEMDFSIQARIPRPVADGAAPISADFSGYLASIKFKTPPPPDPKGKGRARPAANPEARSGTEGAQ